MALHFHSFRLSQVLINLSWVLTASSQYSGWSCKLMRTANVMPSAFSLLFVNSV